MWPRLLQVICDSKGTSPVSGPQLGMHVVRFTEHSVLGAAAATNTSGRTSVAVSALEPRELDEFVQLVDLLSTGSGVPVSAAASAVVSRLSTAAFWGRALPRGQTPDLTPLLGTVLLGDGRPVAGWFYHGYGESLSALYASVFSSISRAHGAPLQLLATDMHQMASNVYSEGNTARQLAWQKASVMRLPTLRSVHTAQRHALLRCLARPNEQTDGDSRVEDAFMLLQLRKHVWWWKSAAQRDDACQRLEQLVLDSGLAPPRCELGASLSTLLNTGAPPATRHPFADPRLARGFFHLTGQTQQYCVDHILSRTVLTRVRESLQTLREEEDRFSFSSSTASRWPSAHRETSPQYLADRQLQGALFGPVGTSSAALSSTPATASPDRPEVAVFSVGVDAGQYWTGLLRVADFLCGHFEMAASKANGAEREESPLKMLQEWRHTLRVTLGRRYGGASTSVWATPALRQRAFPFLHALQSSLDYEDAMESGQPRLLLLTSNDRADSGGSIILPEQWPQIVESLMSGSTPCFATCSLDSATATCVRGGERAVVCRLVGTDQLDSLEVILSTAQWRRIEELLTPDSASCATSWACLVLNESKAGAAVLSPLELIQQGR